MLVTAPTAASVPKASTDELGRDLLEACRRGDRSALTCFVRCYEKRVFAFLSRCLGRQYPIEDLAQEVFVRAFPALLRFESEGEAKLSTWLLTIAHRVAVDARRRDRGRHVPFEPEEHRGYLESPEERLHHERLLGAVARVVAELEPEQRDVFVLSTFHELSTKEIAAIVGSFEATVKTRLHRARAKLKLALGPEFSVKP